MERRRWALEQLETIRQNMNWIPLEVSRGSIDGENLQRYTPFPACKNEDETEIRSRLVDALSNEPELDRSMGCLVGMVVGDAVGAPLEFLDACDAGQGSSCFDLVSNSYTQEFNKFQLDRGQWTDDASMGLCLADSLLCCGVFDGSDIRLRFWSWWFRGYNNAFRKDFTRSGSVGLGGNISRSLFTMEHGKVPTPTYEAKTEDAGNGSLMRLGAVPLFFRHDVKAASDAAAASSLTTHPGAIAAEACRFVAQLVVRAIARRDTAEDPRPLIDSVVQDYLGGLAHRANEPGVAELSRLLRSAEPESSLERNWNWRSKRLEVVAVINRRGHSYNGYPVSAGYFGSFSLDALAIALNSVYHTDSFNEAISRCVNFLGDADSTAAIAGQIAGALYGYRFIDQRWIAQMQKWDDGQIALRALLLAVRPKGPSTGMSRTGTPAAQCLPAAAAQHAAMDASVSSAIAGGKTLVSIQLSPQRLMRDGQYEWRTCGMHADLLVELRAVAASRTDLQAHCERWLNALCSSLGGQHEAALVVAPPIGDVQCYASRGDQPEVVVWLLLDPLDIDSKQTTFARGNAQATAFDVLYKWRGGLLEFPSGYAEPGEHLLDDAMPPASATPTASPAVCAGTSECNAMSSLRKRRHISGLWIGEAVPNAEFAADIPPNPIKWACSLLSSAPKGASIVGAGFFDDAADVPGQPILFYTLKGDYDPGDGSVVITKTYDSKVVAAHISVTYRGRVSFQESGTPCMSGTWVNNAEGSHGTFGCALEE